jgi:hypothetical protein
MGLLRSESLRFRSRRLFATLFVLAAVGAIVGVMIGAIQSSKPSAAEMALAERQYHARLRACLSGETLSPSELPQGITLEDFCNSNVRVTDFLTGHSLELVRVPVTLENTAFIVIVLGLVIGASSVGADWQAGSFGTVLTWESRRLRVLGARSLVVGVGVLALVVCLQAILGGSLWLGALLRGSTLVPPGWFGDTVGTALRIELMAVAAALIGVAVSTLGRTTSATLAGMFIYFAVFESLVRGLLPKLAPYLLATNVVITVLGHAASPGTQMTISLSHSHVVVLVYVVGLLALAFVVFARRDVTT